MTTPTTPAEAADDFDLRGVLAAELKCWHRLTGEEVENLLAFVRKLSARPTELPPKPVSVFQHARCSETLRMLGRPYPRTCAECGLGPCKTRAAAEVGKEVGG